MAKYRKKPVVIEAFQMTSEHRWNNCDWPEWLHLAWNMEPDEPGCVFIAPDGNPGLDTLMIATLEGIMAVPPDNWIIQGVKGELYSCDPDIFKATYEPVETPDAD